MQKILQATPKMLQIFLMFMEFRRIDCYFLLFFSRFCLLPIFLSVIHLICPYSYSFHHIVYILVVVRFSNSMGNFRHFSSIYFCIFPHLIYMAALVLSRYRFDHSVLNVMLLSFHAHSLRHVCRQLFQQLASSSLFVLMMMPIAASFHSTIITKQSLWSSE